MLHIRIWTFWPCLDNIDRIRPTVTKFKQWLGYFFFCLIRYLSFYTIGIKIRETLLRDPDQVILKSYCRYWYESGFRPKKSGSTTLEHCPKKTWIARLAHVHCTYNIPYFVPSLEPFRPLWWLKLHSVLTYFANFQIYVVDLKCCQHWSSCSMQKL